MYNNNIIIISSVNGEVWEHLYSIAIVDLILNPAFRGGLLHFEPSDLQACGAAW
jgi:hypothetical protein